MVSVGWKPHILYVQNTLLVRIQIQNYSKSIRYASGNNCFMFCLCAIFESFWNILKVFYLDIVSIQIKVTGHGTLSHGAVVKYTSILPVLDMKRLKNPSPYSMYSTCVNSTVYRLFLYLCIWRLFCSTVRCVFMSYSLPARFSEY